MKQGYFFKKSKPGMWRVWLIVCLVSCTTAAIVFSTSMRGLRAANPNFASTGDWSTFMAGSGHSGYNKAETQITRTSAPNLKLHWSYKAGYKISAQPVVVGGVIYWGSWDGYEHASDLNGNVLWATNLGQVTAKCFPPVAGVASTATVATVTIQGVKKQVVYVAGGTDNFYALDASDGSIIWQVSLGTPPDYMLWGSPVFYQGNVYIGSSSYGDCPLTPGALYEISGTTGTILHSFIDVPPGCVGGGIWDTPTIDTATGELYVTTGTINPCNPLETYAVGFLEFRASDLTLTGAWQVPVADRAPDGDFGTTPTLFQYNSGGTVHYLVGAANKNGKYYAFERGNISAGPIWSTTIATTGSCPQCGDGSISSSAFDGARLYVAGGNTTINGSSCLGSLRALNPVSGKFMWEDCLSDGPVLGAVSVVPGVAVVGAGKSVIVMDTSSGQILTRLTDSSNPSRFYAPASISNGVIYIGNMDWNLFAYGL